MTDWHRRFMQIANTVASWSKHPDMQTGCVIVNAEHAILSTGYNGLARKIRYTPERLERPARSHWFEHAERNAIYNAAAQGVPLRGTTIYVPWYPCAACMRAIIQSGITRVVCQPPSVPDKANPKWQAEFEIAAAMALEAGLEVTYYTEWCCPNCGSPEVFDYRPCRIYPPLTCKACGRMFTEEEAHERSPSADRPIP